MCTKMLIVIYHKCKCKFILPSVELFVSGENQLDFRMPFTIHIRALAGTIVAVFMEEKCKTSGEDFHYSTGKKGEMPGFIK